MQADIKNILSDIKENLSMALGSDRIGSTETYVLGEIKKDIVKMEKILEPKILLTHLGEDYCEILIEGVTWETSISLAYALAKVGVLHNKVCTNNEVLEELSTRL